MSAPADSTKAGDKPVPNDTARLDQPKDAVPMENMTQPASDSPADGSKPDNVEAAPSSGSADAPAPVATEPATTSDAATTKGKEKETAPAPPTKERSDSIKAIGPAVDEIKIAEASTADSGPVCNITLLLTSGSRHPYKLDAKYLSRRNVDIPDKTESGQPDPFSISVYTLKELILREWRSDWEAKPASPSSIRLIHFGKLLDDKEQLKKYQLALESPNVVHMSIRPQDLDEEEPKSGSKNLPGGGGDGARQRSSGCCVVL